jgi:ComF family protein
MLTEASLLINMNYFIKKFFASLFPAKCIVCKKPGNFICSKDLSKIPNAKKPDKDWIFSVWSYKDKSMKKILFMLKFESKFSVIEDLVQTIFDHLTDELHEREVFENTKTVWLVPIPISNKSFRERGYNQSEIISNRLATMSLGKLSNKNILKKFKETKTQHSIKNRSERLSNLRNSFCLKEGVDIKGKNIVLIDDITTTHATLVEARRVLKQHGARMVIAFTIAH